MLNIRGGMYFTNPNRLYNPKGLEFMREHFSVCLRFCSERNYGVLILIYNVSSKQKIRRHSVQPASR